MQQPQRLGWLGLGLLISLMAVGAMALAEPATLGPVVGPVSGAVPPVSPSAAAAPSWTVSALEESPPVRAPDTEPGLSLAGDTYLGAANLVSAADPQGTTSILVTLDVTNATELDGLLANLQNASSPEYHHYLTHAQFDQEFGGDPTVLHTLVAYFASFGVGPVTTTADRLTISFSATPTEVDEIFHTGLATYLSPSGQAYFAPVSAPTIPTLAAPYVAEVSGFSNYSVYLDHVDSRMVTERVDSEVVSAVTGSASTAQGPLSPGGSGNPFTPVTVNGTTYDKPYYVNRGSSATCDVTVCGDFPWTPDLQVTYNETPVFHKYGYPRGATVVAMLWDDTVCTSNTSTCKADDYYSTYCSGLTSGQYAWDFYLPDVDSYWNYTLPAGEPMPRAYGLPVSTGVTYSYPAGSGGLSASCDRGGAEEESTLDVAMEGAMAPGANVVDVFTSSSTTSALATELGYIASPSTSEFSNAGGTDTSSVMTDLANASVVANSWGGTTGAELGASWDTYVAELEATGTTVVASSGDGGGNAVAAPAEETFDTSGTVAVGGTTVVVSNSTLLRTAPHTAVLTAPYFGVGGGEVVWFQPAGTVDGFSTTYGTTGGVTASSTNYAPTWQNNSSDPHSVIVGITPSGYGRGEPDTSSIANDTIIDIEIGWLSENITCTVTSSCTRNAGLGTYYAKGWSYFVGTSISDQVTAGMIGTIDAALSSQGQGKLGFMDPTMYWVGNLEAHGDLALSPFYGITTYHNSEPASTYGAFSNGSWNADDGWGTLSAWNYTQYAVAYTTTFTESGLPSGTWTVVVTPTVGDEGCHVSGSACANNASGTSNAGTAVLFARPYGTYTYTVSSSLANYSAAGGSYVINGAADSVSITFAQLVVHPTATPDPTQPGAAVTISAGASGGSGTYTKYTWSGTVPTGCSLPSGTSTSSFGCTPASGSQGSYAVAVQVKDSHGGVASGSVTLTVDASLGVTLSASPTHLDVGQQSTLTLGFSGGVAPISWTLARSGSATNLSGVAGGSYTFMPGSAGAYTFYLNASDSVGSTSRASVSVTVSPALVVSPSASVDPVDVGEATTVSAEASGGSGTYSTYVWSGLPAGCSSPGSVASFVCSPSAVGSYTVSVSATDSNANTVAGSFVLTVTAALAATPSATPNPTEVGARVSVSAGAAGGSGTYTAYSWSGLPAGCPNPGSVASFSCTPSAAGTSTVSVTVTDSNGAKATGSFSLTVDASLAVSLSGSPSTTQVGGASVLTLGFSGGVGPIRWTLEEEGSAANLTGVSDDRYTFTPGAAGVYAFDLNATDGAGASARASATVTVEPRLVATLTSSSTALDVGQRAELTVGLSGGVLPRTWTLTANGSSANLTGVTGSQYVFAPRGAGTYAFYLNATDAVGSTSDTKVVEEVSPALTAGTVSAAPNPTQVGGRSTLDTTGATGGAGDDSYTWSGLPPGCPSPGNVRSFGCAPNASGEYVVTVTVQDENGMTASTSFTFVVDPALAVTLSASPSMTDVGRSSELTLGFSGGVAPVAWTLEESGVPGNLSGVSDDEYTFLPTEAGTYTFYLNATDAVGSPASATASVTVGPTFAVSLSATPSMTQVGNLSVLTLGFSGGTAPVTWTLEESGSLANLTGVSGTTYSFAPRTAGVYTFYLNATDGAESAATAATTVTVEGALAVTLSATPSTTQVGGTSVLTLGFAGGVAPITWTLSVNGSLNVSGVVGNSYVFVPGAPGTYTFVLAAVDAVGGPVNATATVTVEPALAVTLSAAPPRTDLGTASTVTLGFSGGVAPVSWTLEESGSSTNLTGVSGNAYAFWPTGTGTYTFYLNATDAVGSPASATVTVVVGPALTATLSATLTTTEVERPSNLTLGFSGGVAPVTWTLTEDGSGNLTGASGDTYSFTPTEPGTYTFELSATDAVGGVASASVRIEVEPALGATLGASATLIEVGDSSELELGFTGGVAPVRWTLEESGTSGNLSGVAGNAYAFTSTVPGRYTFTLAGTDAVGVSSSASVTVTVVSGFGARLSASPATTEVGASSVLTLSFAGGEPPVGWTLEESGSLANLTGVTGDSYTFSPGVPGAYTFYLNATDGLGHSASSQVTVTVVTALRVSLSARPGTTEVGVSSGLTLGFAGGVAPITWTLTVNGVPSNLSGTVGDTYTFTPTGPGTYAFELSATDAVGSQATASATVLVEPALAVTLGASLASIDVGQATRLTLGVSGGVTPVVWTLTEDGSGNLSGVVVDSYLFAPLAAGDYTFLLAASDAVGGEASISVTVEVAPELGAGTLSATPNPVVVGHPTTVGTAGPTGGLGPYSYAWSGLPPGCGNPGDLASFVCTPTASGTYTVRLEVTDSNGATAGGQEGLTVSSSAPPPPATYSVTFTETGLPPTTLAKDGWTVVLNGSRAWSSSATIRFGGVPAGAQTLLLVGPAGYALRNGVGVGMVTISGNTSVSVPFAKGKTATLTFSEKGLPRGQAWCVSVNGFVRCSTGTSVRYLNLTEVPPSLATGERYDYAVVSPWAGQKIAVSVGKTPYPASGTISPSRSLGMTVAFAYDYAVMFTETGAPSGMWSVTVGKMTVANGTGDPIWFELPNGTYHYRVGPVTGYTSAGLPRTVAVRGGPVAVTVTYTKKVPVPSVAPRPSSTAPGSTGIGALARFAGLVPWTLTVLATPLAQAPRRDPLEPPELRRVKAPAPGNPALRAPVAGPGARPEAVLPASPFPEKEPTPAG